VPCRAGACSARRRLLRQAPASARAGASAWGRRGWLLRCARAAWGRPSTRRSPPRPPLRPRPRSGSSARPPPRACLPPLSFPATMLQVCACRAHSLADALERASRPACAAQACRAGRAALTACCAGYRARSTRVVASHACFPGGSRLRAGPRSGARGPRPRAACARCAPARPVRTRRAQRRRRRCPAGRRRRGGRRSAAPPPPGPRRWPELRRPAAVLQRRPVHARLHGCAWRALRQQTRLHECPARAHAARPCPAAQHNHRLKEHRPMTSSMAELAPPDHRGATRSVCQHSWAPRACCTVFALQDPKAEAVHISGTAVNALCRQQPSQIRGCT
jgi:hypothetical protein